MLLVPVSFGQETPNILSKSYVDVYATENNQVTFTSTGSPLGTADSTRRIVMAMGAFGLQYVASVSIGGVGATMLAEWGLTEPCWWIAHVPSGTTGTISVTWDSTEGGMWWNAWAVYGLNSNDCLIDAQTVGAAVTDPSITLDCVTGGLMMAASRNNIPAAYGAWTGATQDYEFGASLEGINWAVASEESSGGGTHQIWVDINYAARLTGISIGG